MRDERLYPDSAQPELPMDQLILKEWSQTEDDVPMDVIFVGGGPAGLSGAIELARLIKKDNENGGDLGDIEIGVLEKSANLGGHCLSGAVVNPRSLYELFPELTAKDFPFRGEVKGDRVYFLTEQLSMRIPTPPTMHNENNYIVSICELVRWLGEKAEAEGVNILPSFPAQSLLLEGDRIAGVATTPAGLNRDGSQSGNYMPSTNITAQVTVLSEGTRGTLAQAYLKSQNLEPESSQIYALGVKELWRTKKVPEYITHTMGWPLPTDAFGGSFMYPMGEDLVSVGLVVGLDYKEHNFDVHKTLQRMKAHPLFKKYLDGGEIVEWGAKTIPEGGYHAIPERLHGNGLLLLGDSAGLVNVPALKGIHYAIHSGILAARSIFKALKAKDTSAKNLKSYDEQLRSSFVFDDLKKVRNMRQAFKSGFYIGGAKAAMMTATGGNFPPHIGAIKEDAAEEKHLTLPEDAPSGTENMGLSKVDAVYLSGNKTRDDIPQHLTVGKDISPEMADFYSHMCPAGVYEQEGDQLVVNAPNCVDCKATDILGPRWEPREGGSGPDYKTM